MEESDEYSGYITMFDDDILLTQTNWDYLLSKKVPLDNWKELENNKINIHANTSKDEMLDQFEKEICAVKLMIEESLGLHNSITLEEVSELWFGRNGVVCKSFVQQNAPILSDYDNFTSFIENFFLLTRSSSSASSLLLNKEANSFLILIWLKEACHMTIA